VSGTGSQHSVYARVAGEPPELDTQIFSDHAEFHNDSGVSIYQGNVRAYDPEMNLRSPRLTLRFAKSTAGTNRLDYAVAESGVVIDFSGKAFAPGDLTNFNAFAAKMNQPRRPIDEFVRAHLAQPTRDLLAGYPSTPNAKLTNAVAGDLNRLVESGAIYDENRFAGIYLSPDTKNLLDRQPQGADLMQLNRLLLLDAFGDSIFRSQKGDATRGTGERATYTHKTPGGDNDVLIELSGSPKLEKPKSTMTAEEKILYDQAAGKFYSFGRSDLVTQMAGLSAKPLQGETSQPKTKKR
jgi:lipopolysaccharide export system protein LptA